jgi:GWxTD domain-containing protein
MPRLPIIPTIAFVFLAAPVLAQEPSGLPVHHRCFEHPADSKQVLHRLSDHARAWLAEDAIYLITPDERCAFLHLESDEERDQFIDQFWFRRDHDPQAPDNAFKVEHYRRIVFANQSFGASIAGWKTDRGRIYVILGPPDSITASRFGDATTNPMGQDSEVLLHPTQTWRYRELPGVGSNADFVFAYTMDYHDYKLVFPGTESLARVDPGILSGIPARLDNETPQQLELVIRGMPVQAVKFKDLEAIVTSRMVRDQILFRHSFAFLPATHATTLARLHLSLPRPPNVVSVSAPAYAIFIRVSQPSERIANITELTVPYTNTRLPKSVDHLETDVDIPLPPGPYHLDVVAKNLATNQVGSVTSKFDVPPYDQLAKYR